MDIEEDIKILQEFTELDRKLRNYKVESDYDNFCERRCVAIDHILAEREEDKKRIKELEAKLEFKEFGDLDNVEFEEYMSQFIPKQDVIETLNRHKLAYEEFNIMYNNTHYEDDEIRARDFYVIVTEDRIVQVLTKLLGGEK